MSGEWDGLRAAAEAATAGPWAIEHDEYGDEWWFGGLQEGGQITVGGIGRTHRIVADARQSDDMAYIAAASPDMVLRLLDRLQAAEDALRRIISDEVWNGADDPEDVMHQIANDALTAAAKAPLSASGAESDHGGRRDGEGLG